MPGPRASTQGGGAPQAAAPVAGAPDAAALLESGDSAAMPPVAAESGAATQSEGSSPAQRRGTQNDVAETAFPSAPRRQSARGKQQHSSASPLAAHHSPGNSSSPRYGSSSPAASPLSNTRDRLLARRESEPGLQHLPRLGSTSPGQEQAEQHHYYRIRFKPGRDSSSSVASNGTASGRGRGNSLVSGDAELVGADVGRAPIRPTRSTRGGGRGRNRAKTDPTPVAPSTLMVRGRG